LGSIDLFAGGACNFKNNHKAPFNSMTSCGNQALFKDGAGCGACYQVLDGAEQAMPVKLVGSDHLISLVKFITMSTNVLISGGPDMLPCLSLRVSISTYFETLTFCFPCLIGV
jgi:hypothetical protein